MQPNLQIVSKNYRIPIKRQLLGDDFNCKKVFNTNMDTGNLYGVSWMSNSSGLYMVMYYYNSVRNCYKKLGLLFCLLDT